MSSTPVKFLRDVQLQRSAMIVGYTLLVYDYFLTIGDEIEYIWNSPWTRVKAVYLLNRYVVIFGQTVICIQDSGIFPDAISQRACEVYTVFLGVHIVLSMETVHLLVILRAWVIWGACPYLLLLIAIAYIATLASIVPGVVRGHDFSSFESLARICYRPIPGKYQHFVHCVISYTSPCHSPCGEWNLYLASLILDTFVYSFTAYALWSFRKTFGKGCPPLVRILMKNATAFYLVNVCYHIGGLVCWTVFADSPKSLIAPGLASPVMSICGQRVVHNLRRIKITSFSTQDLSHEVSRQMKGFTFSDRYAREARDQAIPVILGEEEQGIHRSIEMADMSGHDVSSYDADDDSALPRKPSLHSPEDRSNFGGSPV
ncbi:hypothetical protein J3A83DRAFT_4375385 [Scleroderma citrinum]